MGPSATGHYVLMVTIFYIFTIIIRIRYATHNYTTSRRWHGHGAAGPQRRISMRKPLTIFFAVAFGALTAGAQKPFPRGTMVVLPVDDPNLSGEACWSDPNIIGVALRTTWRGTEGTQGNFNWKQFDQGIALAQTNNKFVVLSISAVRPPPWVTSVVKTWTNSLHKTCPYPWDPNLQSFWGTLIKTMGQRYDSVRVVHGVDMWTGGTGGAVGDGTGIDCIFAPSATDCSALDAIAGGGQNSGNTLWSNACKALCTIYADAFSTTPCFIHPGTNYVNLDPQSMTDIATWWLNLRLNANSLFNNEFNAVVPRFVRALGYIPWPNTSLNIATVNNGMFQTKGPIGSSVMKGETLAQVFQNVQNIIAVQIYPTDPATDPGEQTIINFNKSVGR
jgi:hypothetical protein